MAPSPAPRTLVLVDDDAGFRGRARQLLEAGGFTVIGEAADGAGAHAVLRRTRPEVVLIDVGLPDVDGLDLAGHLRAEEGALVVIAVSGRDASDYGTRVAEADVTGFISKVDLTASAVLALISGAEP